jgi:hypothetical protein
MLHKEVMTVCDKNNAYTLCGEMKCFSVKPGSMYVHWRVDFEGLRSEWTYLIVIKMEWSFTIEDVIKWKPPVYPFASCIALVITELWRVHPVTLGFSNQLVNQ